MTFNSDGTVTVKRDEDKQRECELNATLSAMKEQITPLVEFIRSTIFGGKEIVAQELTVNEEMRIMALCDLSTMMRCSKSRHQRGIPSSMLSSYSMRQEVARRIS